MDITPVDPNPVQLPTQEIPVPVVQDTRTVPIQENPSAGLDAIFQASQVQPISEIPQPQVIY